jgi:hypothetical protein
MSDIQKAETVLAELTEKRDAHLERGTKLAADRREIAFAANTGDQGARKKLDALNHESALHERELENLSAAIEEANKRLDAARREETLKGDRKKAALLRELLPRFVAHGEKIDELLASLVAESNAMAQTLREMNALGCANPSDRQLHVNASFVIHTAMSQSPWRSEFRHLRPEERRTFGALFDGANKAYPGGFERGAWKITIERSIEALEGRPPRQLTGAAGYAKDAAA